MWQVLGTHIGGQMNIKNWLIHKLGGRTWDEPITKPDNIVQYQTAPILTYQGTYIHSADTIVPQDEIEHHLGLQFLPVIKENMEVERIELLHIHGVQYVGRLKIVGKK